MRRLVALKLADVGSHEESYGSGSALVELEMKGWLTVERFTNFGYRNLAAEYTLSIRQRRDRRCVPVVEPDGLPAPMASRRNAGIRFLVTGDLMCHAPVDIMH
jgi:hypothetical protein